MKEFYSMDEILALLVELQDAGIDIDSIPLDVTVHELHSMVDAL